MVRNARKQKQMYHTPRGDRVLHGAERRIFTQSLAMIVDLLAQGDADFGVTPFDELQWNQKVVVLYDSARALLHPTEPTPKLTANIESAVAIVYEHVKHQVDQEIDDPDISREKPFWRRLALDAAGEQVASDELPDESNCDKETWSLLVECLAGSVLWDNDYEWQELLDLPPEESKTARAKLGMGDDYYTDVPPDPPDDQIKLYVDALMGLTADAR